MAVFRVEKTKDFTVMSNHHLRNVSLSLKAKGLLSLMLSLPDNWDYTTKGLAHICKDGVDSISSAIKELEKQGYLTRRREALDGRTYSLFLTPQGQELVPVIRRALEQWWEQLTAQADLSQEELEIILPLLRKMSDSSSLTLMKIINTNH